MHTKPRLQPLVEPLFFQGRLRLRIQAPCARCVWDGHILIVALPFLLGLHIFRGDVLLRAGQCIFASAGVRHQYAASLQVPSPVAARLPKAALPWRRASTAPAAAASGGVPTARQWHARFSVAAEGSSSAGAFWSANRSTGRHEAWSHMQISGAVNGSSHQAGLNQAWRVAKNPDAASMGKQFLSALCIAVAAGAATFFINVDVALATEAAGGLRRGAGALATVSESGVDVWAVARVAAHKALGGGMYGAMATIMEVFSLMWLRTAMNYQYRYGGDLGSVLKKLLAEGGIPRLYQGLRLTLIQAPLIRFGGIAAYVGVLAFFDGIPGAAELPVYIRTAVCSITAGLWRIVCMPVDTCKIVMQVEGRRGLKRLRLRVLKLGLGPLFQGAIAAVCASTAGHYPWYLTYNFLDINMPIVAKEKILMSLVRAALIGVSATFVSDLISNSLRVIKTTQQTASLIVAAGDDNNDDSKFDVSKKGLSIPEALALVLDAEGIRGLFGRGLRTRALTNGLNGALFGVLWRYFQLTGLVR